MTLFIVFFSVSFVMLHAYLFLGKKWKIYDVPNERSSHHKIVVRGSGIVLLVLNIIGVFFVNDVSDYLLLGGLSIGVVTGFLDDYRSLKTSIRFLLYLSAILLILFGVAEIQNLPLIISLLTIIVLLGAVNTYNFMDGINGITAIYSLVFLFTSLFLFIQLNANDTTVVLYIYLAFFAAFFYFNFRKNALLFLGDSGSVSMGLLAAFVVVQLGQQLESWTPIVLLSVYGVDSVGTIILRILRKENIFKAHRSHLYQDLVHIKKWSHLQVSVFYGLLQLGINAIYLAVYTTEISVYIVTLILTLLAIGYYLSKKSIQPIILKN